MRPVLRPPVTARELLQEERRLFYVACTRARERLVVTAVQSPEDDGDQPSRFLAELGIEPEHHKGRPARPLSMGGLVAELRRTAADPEADPALRRAAARRLARLAGEQAGGRALVPRADPATWWGTRALSASTTPVRDPDAPVPVSASVLTAVEQCPTHWFLEREAGGVQRAHQAANLGQLVHALADRVAKGELGQDPDDVDALMGFIEPVWGRLEFRTPWSAVREHERMQLALGRFLRWHHTNQRELLGTEVRFSTEVLLPSGERVRLSGYADRLELDTEGRVVVVDLKTARRAPSGPAVERDLQLALYQLAVDNGAVDELVGRQVRSGGAELLQLGGEDPATAARTQGQPAPTDDGPARRDLTERLERVARQLREETFPARTGDHCKGCAFLPVCPARSAGTVFRQ